MIEDILPSPVVAVEAFGDLADVTLFPEEEAVIAKAVAKRRGEFTTARGCARAALAKIGVPPVPILPGPRGAPQWPEGVVGSITHCAGYRACAVARAGEIMAIGLDAEPHDTLPNGVLEAIALPAEQVRLAALTAVKPDICWDRMLFCAKESVYKAWFPLTHRWLGFEEASIEIDPANGSFSARLLVDGPVVNNSVLTEFNGRWLVRDGFIVTAIVIPLLPAAILSHKCADPQVGDLRAHECCGSRARPRCTDGARSSAYGPAVERSAWSSAADLNIILPAGQARSAPGTARSWSRPPGRSTNANTSASPAVASRADRCGEQFARRPPCQAPGAAARRNPRTTVIPQVTRE
jgi:4'-phosphopantetheinyl transferase EntD